jgi:uncharacterized membrane protein
MKISRRSLLHVTFEFGITMKCIDGVVQLVAGALLWILAPEAFSHYVQLVLEHIFPNGAHGFPAKQLFAAAQGIAGGGQLFAALYLMSHGAVKIAIVIALWMNKLWAYPVAIIVFSGFVVYQMYRYTYTHSPFLIWLSVFDVLVVWLTWREYEAQKSLRIAPNVA